MKRPDEGIFHLNLTGLISAEQKNPNQTLCISTLDGDKVEKNIMNLKRRWTSAPASVLLAKHPSVCHDVSRVCSQCIVAAAAGHQGCGYKHPSTINHSAAPFHALTCATTLLIMSPVCKIQETVCYLLFLLNWG